MITLYSIICFSPLIDEVQTKFYLGYVAISIVVIHLIVNLSMIFVSTLNLVKRKCKLAARRKALKH